MQQTQVIGFWKPEGPYGWMGNWYPAKFRYAGRWYLNSEQWMMSQKVLVFGREDLAEKIMATADPKTCKDIAKQKFPEYNEAVWRAVKYRVVKRGVLAKFRQHEELAKALFETGDAILCEASPYDKNWGVGVSAPACKDVSQWNGENYLGRILMEVRAELQTEFALRGGECFTYEPAPGVFPEWELSGNELVHIPQYHATVHAYSDTLGYGEKKQFFSPVSLKELEAEGLFRFGFGEMKQDVWETSRRLHLYR